jgi:hypothetical protein
MRPETKSRIDRVVMWTLITAAGIGTAVLLAHYRQSRDTPPLPITARTNTAPPLPRISPEALQQRKVDRVTAVNHCLEQAALAMQGKAGGGAIHWEWAVESCRDLGNSLYPLRPEEALEVL